MHTDPNTPAQPMPPDGKGFARWPLAAPLLQALDELAYREPTPVQAQTLPAALAGGDWMVSSQTGSGKTCAFLLPVLTRLWSSHMTADLPRPRSRRAAAAPSALVLCPTREMAQQVMQEAIRLVRHARGLRIASVTGGAAFGKQLQDLRGASLVVATPGRLLDLARNGQIELDSVQALIVDEADRMLDLGFSEDLEAIHQACAQRQQTLMFSATFAPRIMALATAVMHAPGRIELASAHDRHGNISQHLHWFDDEAHRQALLEHYLQSNTLSQAIVFTSTQVECDDIAAQLLEAGYRAAALHGAMPQATRNRRILGLRQGRTQILVATDVAARGIDVPGISHVINYGLPMKPEDYVHRIGRTGRAGKHGTAITLASLRDRRDRFRIRDLERFLGRPLEASELAGLEPRSRPQPRFAEQRERRSPAAMKHARFADTPGTPGASARGRAHAPLASVHAKLRTAAPKLRNPQHTPRGENAPGLNRKERRAHLQQAWMASHATTGDAER